MELDQEGKLTQALPVYETRAKETLAQGDRLRWAGALLRAGREQEARAVFDQLLAEDRTSPHTRGGPGGHTAAVCASTALAAGAPGVAVSYARTAARQDPDDERTSLLLARALVAAGDRSGARTTLKALDGTSTGWSDGFRIELARWQLLAGDPAPARRVLERTLPEVVAQMVQDSVRANMLLARGDWEKAEALLRASERKVPKGLDERRVDVAWRNVQRELRWVRLRRSLALWRLEGPAAAVPEAAKAEASDEAYVHAAAVLLLAACDAADGRRDDAAARLGVLAGHDPRLAEVLGKMSAALRSGEDRVAAARSTVDALAAQDRSADLLSAAVADALGGASATCGSETARR
jgi:tetratricopeptide (TPR) repeat protein